MSGETVQLIRTSDNACVAAEFLSALQPTDLLLVEQEWGLYRQQLRNSLLDRGVPLSQWPESLHWDWSDKMTQLQTLAKTVCGITCEGKWQAVMLTDTATYQVRLDSDRGKPLVYVSHLEVAPWNWKHQFIDEERRFKGIGKMLFRAAMRQSVDEGFHGRVGLHSLPQSEGFYEDACGMTRLGADPRKEHLVYFELSRDEASRRLEMEG